MKLWISFIFCSFSLTAASFAQEPGIPTPPAPTPVVSPANTDDTIELKFDETGEGVTIEAFVKICQQNTGFTFTFSDDPQAKQQLSTKIRILGTLKIPKKEFYSTFQTIMKINDFVCVEMGQGAGRIIVITSLKSTQPAAKQQIAANAVFVADPTENLEQYAAQPGVLVTTVFRLKYQDPQRLSTSLRQYFPDQQLERVLSVGTTGLLITSFGPNVYAMKSFLELLDVPPDKGDPPILEIVPLEFAAAEEIEPILSELITRQSKGRGQQIRSPEGATAALQPEEDYEIKIITDSRTNSLLVQAAKSDIPWVLDLISRLDTKLDAPESNFHVYEVKNVEAAKLADNLSKFLEQTQTAVQQAQQSMGRSSARSGGGAGGGSPIPAAHEQKPVVIADEQTNSIMITASKTRWSEIKNLLERLDVRQPQVLIETALVELNINDEFQLGIELAEISGGRVPQPGQRGAPGFLTSFGLSELEVDEATGFPTGRNPLSDTGGSLRSGGGLLAGYLRADDVKLPAILSALKSRDNANILSIPSVLVTNNTSAKIVSQTTLQTQQIQQQGGTTAPIVGAGASGSAGITLSISPAISAANYLRLNIDLNVSSFGGTGGGATLPDKTERSMQTSVFVPDGSTLYIGGIVVDENREGASGVPILMDIPLIGQLFRSDNNSNNKVTLYFFISPKIIKEEDFTDLVDISYQRKLQANSIVGSHKLMQVDPNFTPLEAPGGEADMKKLESTFFDIPIYKSPSQNGKSKEEKSSK